MPTIRSATITACIAAVVWFGLLCLGVSVIASIKAQHANGYPNWAQIGLWLGIPAIAFAILTFSLYFFNRVRRSPIVLGVVAASSLIVILPFIMTFAGGV